MIFIILAVICAAIVVPCIIGAAVSNSDLPKEPQQVTHSGITIDGYIVDEYTGCEYLLIWSPRVGTIVMPRYYPNGTIVNHHNGGA